jgi:hypothetical protein
MTKKAIFDPKNDLFRSNMGLLSSKLGQKNGNGELFAAEGPNNNFFGQIRAKTRKNRSGHSSNQPKNKKTQF